MRRETTGNRHHPPLAHYQVLARAPARKPFLPQQRPHIQRSSNTPHRELRELTRMLAHIFNPMRSLTLRILIIALTVATEINAQATPLQAPATLAQIALDQVPALRANVTLGAWKAAHQADTVTRYAPLLDDQSHGTWCARSRADIPVAGGRAARRTTYFYPPAPPAILAVPVSRAPAQLVDQCRAGMVWVSVHDADTVRTDALKREAEAALTATVGPADTTTKLTWLGSASWLRPTLRNVDGLAVATATVHQRFARTGEAIGDSTHVLVAVTSPASGVSLRSQDWLSMHHDEYDDARRRLAPRIDEALRIAAIGGATESDFRSFRTIFEADPDSPRQLAPGERIAFADAIDHWMSHAAGLQPPRRAAALFAADEVLNESGVSAGWEDSVQQPLRQRLEARGAAFAWLELGGGFEYTHTWLKDALQLAPESRAGELAFLTLAEYGFETSGSCSDQGGEGFRAVIARGEQYIRQHPASPMRGDIHLLIAQAHSDIVALAEGGGYDAADDSAETKRYAPEGPKARVRAVAEYTIALRLAGDTPRARAAWSEAWRLVAGLAPTGTHFYCVYD